MNPNKRHRRPPQKNPEKYVYVITDEALTNFNQLQTTLLPSLKKGVPMVQYRDKSQDLLKRRYQARTLKKLCRRTKTLLIINDDWSLCRWVKADGVHIGQNDASMKLVRRHLGPNAIIGQSCYNSTQLAAKAIKNRSDYIAFGSIYASPTKPNAIRAPLKCLRFPNKIKQRKVPCVAIGGISRSTITEIINSGADYAALISGFWQSDAFQSGSCEK